MDDMIVLDSISDSDSDVMEISIPQKPHPPLINIDVEDELVLNVSAPLPKTPIVKHLVKTVTVNMGIEDTTAISPSHWTANMRKFYNEDWGNEEGFVVDLLQSKMNKHPNLWKLSPQDKKQSYKSKLKCFNCSECGHVTQCCPNPPKVLKCHMCGGQGHLSTRCNMTKCLGCGVRSTRFMKSCQKCCQNLNQQCARCGLKGHVLVDCTDNWRRFHMTTGVKTGVQCPQKNIYKTLAKLWCCNCGRQGHNELHCRSPNSGSFPVSSPYVISYFSSFNIATDLNPGQTFEPPHNQGPNEATTPSTSAGIPRKTQRYFQAEVPEAKVVRPIESASEIVTQLHIDKQGTQDIRPTTSSKQRQNQDKRDKSKRKNRGWRRRTGNRLNICGGPSQDDNQTMTQPAKHKDATNHANHVANRNKLQQISISKERGRKRRVGRGSQMMREVRKWFRGNDGPQEVKR